MTEKTLTAGELAEQAQEQVCALNRTFNQLIRENPDVMIELTTMERAMPQGVILPVLAVTIRREL